MRKSRHGTNRRDSADDRLNIIFFSYCNSSGGNSTDHLEASLRAPATYLLHILKWKWEKHRINFQLRISISDQSTAAAAVQRKLIDSTSSSVVHVDFSTSKSRIQTRCNYPSKPILSFSLLRQQRAMLRHWITIIKVISKKHRVLQQYTRSWSARGLWMEKNIKKGSKKKPTKK